MTPPRYFCARSALWLHPDLSLPERMVLATLANLADDAGRVARTSGKVASLLAIPHREAKDILASLQSKGAVSASLDDKGSQMFAILPLRKQYLPGSENPPEDAKKPKGEAIDYDDVLAHWRASNPDLPQPRAITEKQKALLRTLLKNNKATLDDLYRAFDAVGCSDFLQGRRTDFKADLTWVLMDRGGSFSRIECGAFHRSPAERAAFERIYPQTDNSDNNEYYK